MTVRADKEGRLPDGTRTLNGRLAVDGRMLNAMSVDLEDWFCVYNLSGAIPRKRWDDCESRVGANTRRLLELFAKHDVRATFFVLGWIAERHPGLIAEISERGHEIATHGYSHTMLTELSPLEFEEDLKKALAVTQKSTRDPIVGFRAPSFSLTSRTMWALDVLSRHGIRYDSSVYPVAHHPDYGIPDAELSIHQITDSVTEFPLGCAELFGARVPCSGGGYFRMMPYPATRWLLERCNRQGRPFVFYIHPWEIDPGQPRVPAPALKRFRHYINLDKTHDRLDRLLGSFRFTSIRDILHL